MIAALALTGYAVLVGAVVPYGLARARWAHRAPAVAVLAWQGLMVTFVVSVALAAYHLVLTEEHVHRGLVGLLSICGVAAEAPAGADGAAGLGGAGGAGGPGGPGGPGGASAASSAGGTTPPDGGDVALLAPVAVALLPLGWLLRTVWRSRRARQRRLDLLALVGVPAPEYGATVVEHDVPAVYCLPGRRRRVVVSRGALDVLSDEQLRAVLAHEHAHLAGRHHLPRMAAEAFARAFPGLPLARHATAQTALLLEMAADDRALRRHPRETLAAAMCEVAAGRAPRGALGAGGPGTLIRVRRVLAPQPRPHRATWLAIVAASVAAPVLPLLLTCGPTL
ncbi:MULTISPECIES: M56 family metallopeptidase [unclassified Streptomyces]|uniref:M56 family metallopeptidase n=1 Tax=unclassified Streptomyces TaxID=2593676 RepID=UPI00380B21E6